MRVKINKEFTLVQDHNAIHVASKVGLVSRYHARKAIGIVIEACQDAANHGRTTYYQGGGDFDKKDFDEAFKKTQRSKLELNFTCISYSLPGNLIKQGSTAPKRPSVGTECQGLHH